MKKLTALQDVVNLEINKLRSKRTKLEDNSYGEERLKWLRRYKRYFLFRQRKLQILLNGKYDKELKTKFYETFKIDDITSQDKTSKELIDALFEVFEEEIFKSEFELILRDMPFSEKKVSAPKFNNMISLCQNIIAVLIDLINTCITIESVQCYAVQMLPL